MREKNTEEVRRYSEERAKMREKEEEYHKGDRARKEKREEDKVYRIGERGRRKEREERKAVLLDFAKVNHFDPLVAGNWYNTSRQKFLKHPVRTMSFLFARISKNYLRDIK